MNHIRKWNSGQLHSIILLFACCMLLGRSAQAGTTQQSEGQQAANTIKHFAALVDSNRCDAAYGLILSDTAVDKKAELAQLKELHRVFGYLGIGGPASERAYQPYAVLNFGSGCSGPSIEYSLALDFQRGDSGIITGEFATQDSHLLLRRVSVKVLWSDQKDRQAFMAISTGHPKWSR